jgi:anti-sigma-K factor RskA
MNIAEYISSGILEQYITGQVSPQEKQEVECMSHIYPEIHAELVSMQSALEQLAQAEKKTPPAFLKQQILQSLQELKKEETSFTSQPEQPVANVSVPQNAGLRVSYKRWQIAASILAVVTLGVGTLFFQKKQAVQNQQIQLAALQSEIKDIAVSNNKLKEQLGVVTNASYLPIALKGIPTKSPESTCTLYWNKANQEVYIAVTKLPVPEANKQYQLWAIADGKPISLGVLETTQQEDPFQRMKNINNAQAFAITLEKEGGVENPTLTEMYVMGAL